MCEGDGERHEVEVRIDLSRVQFPVFAYCMRRAKPEDADDVFAETFLVVWRRIDEIPPDPGTLPYLYGIAGRVLSTHLRSLHRRTRLDAKLHNLGIAPPADPGAVAMSPNLQEVVAAVNRLGPKDREIVMLYAWRTCRARRSPR